ncbi:MAG: D-alanyl-D-alanine carboxypeptidase [Bacilli bacterium]|nr:D-alanyl-D-alanine carboxypeptidase [Bacilli bacterium]
MKKLFIILLIILLVPIRIKAFNLGESAILMEEDTKRVLVSKNMHKKKLIASTTKIMTAVIAVESGRMNKVVKVNEKVLESYGSNIYLSVGEKIKLKDLVYGLMMQSGNDAALMIADFLGGEEKFVSKMNKKAKKIGMKNTTFKNPHGLDEKTKNYSTAYDMALLMRYANSYPEFRTITGCKKHTVKTKDKTYVWKNKNKLLYSYKYTTGGKTGFTKKARRTLVTSASKDGLNLIAVTLNDSNDFKNHKELYEYGFNNYSMEKVFDKDKLNLPNKKIYALDDYYYPITNKEKDLVVIDYKIKDKEKYVNNQKVGYAIIKLGGNVIHKEKLYIKVKK